MKRTPLRRKSLKKRVVKKLPNKGYQEPKWFKAIKPGAHGQTPAQKRLWRVVSEKYRQDDVRDYGAYCGACGAKMSDWSDLQLGHWLRWSLCKGWMKYERMNLVSICAGCNMKDDAITLKRIGQALERRHGEGILEHIELKNNMMPPTKLETWALVDYAAKIDPDRVY